MRVWTTVLLATAVALAVGVAAAMAAGQGGGNSANAKLCQKGGWQKLGTSDGQGFANEEACVSYAAKGGTLTPLPLPDLQLVVDSCALTGSTVLCSFHVKNVGPGTVTGVVEAQARMTYTTTSTVL